MASKKGGKAKFIPGDLNELLNDSQFLKHSPSNKKTQKRSRNLTSDMTDEEGMPNFIGEYQANAKKKKLEVNVEACKESRQKILDAMNHQQELRKEKSDNLLKSLSEVMLQLEADCNAMKDNEKKLEHLTGAVVKCMQQATVAHKQKLKSLKDIYSSFKKHVEGLLTKGAMRADDRPLWFDVYKAFPPITEPKFAKPKPEIKPIRQILYPEDAVRAKFHSEGHGLTAISLLSQNETPTKRLIQQYEKLKSEGVPEEELIKKSVEAAGIERQAENAAKVIPKNKDSVTAQVLNEADIKNIFKE